LVNGASIRVDHHRRWVTWYHVELDQHDIVLAEGLPAESYLDTGNRALFENSGEPLRLHPDFAGEQRQREMFSCAPFVSNAERIEPVWHALAEWARASGWSVPARAATTDDPDLHLRIGTRRIDPLFVHDGHYTFALRTRGERVRLISRVARPSDATPWATDQRQLGVLVRRIRGRSDGRADGLAMDGPLPGGGWWDVEWHANVPCRWTNGDALLPVRGAGILEVTLGGTMRYPAAGETTVRRSARA
jgi:Hint domain